MKHIVLDVNVLLTLWFGRRHIETVEDLLDNANNENVRFWISASSFSILEYVTIKLFKQKRVEIAAARQYMSQLMQTVEESVTVLTNYGFDQFELYKHAIDFEDAQIAQAASVLHGRAKIVTFDKSFDTQGFVEAVSPAEALAWIADDSDNGNQQVDFVDLKSQQDVLRPDFEKRICRVLNHGKYILDPEVQEFEERLSEYVGVEHSIGVSSGTDALLTVLMALDIGPGDAVFTTPFTFIATAEVISLFGATPVFVDIDPRTFNIDPAQLALAVQAVRNNDSSIYPLPKFEGCDALNPKAIIPVDLFGLPADYDPIMKLAEKNELFVLEDTAQGLGGIHKGWMAGSLGHAAAPVFSRLSRLVVMVMVVL